MKIIFQEHSCQIPCETNILKNLIFINIALNGTTIPMVFDTGASISVISTSLSKMAGISSTREIIKGGGTSGNILKTEKMIVEKLSFGKMIVKDLEIIVAPDENLQFKPNDSEEYLQVHGFLGWDVIKHFYWSIDYKHNIILVRKSEPQDHDKNLMWDNMPIIQVSHGNKPLYFGFDTGHTETIFSHINYFDNSETYSIKEYIQGIDGKRTMDVLKVKTFSFIFQNQSYNLEDISLVNHPLFPTDSVEIYGLFGADILEDRILILDYPNHFIQIS